MADGGLLLNFAAGETNLKAPAPKFKGGSWKERARLTRGAREGSRPKPSSTDAAYQRATRSSDLNPSFNSTHPAKRAKVNGTFRPIHQSSDVSNGEPSAKPRPIHHGNREVISSLFTYNPKPVEGAETTQTNNNEVTANPSNAPLPDGIDTFTSLGLSDTIAAHLLTKMELKTPTVIQKAAVSQLIKEDSDVFIQSETGSGKTLAYLLPLVQRITTMAQRQKHELNEETLLNRDSGLFAIVLAPTRELCKQISVVLERLLTCAHYVVAGTVIGGEKKKSEKARLRKGLNILVATPGRLVDHLQNTQSLDVSNVRYLVLDEGDRLMDLGFEEDITTILRNLDLKKRKISRPGLPDKRITILCSATLRANVAKLGDISLKDAVLVKGSEETEENTTGDENSESVFLAPAQLRQAYTIVAAKLRLVTLTALLKRTFARKGSVMKAIVFMSCADSVDFHFRVLTRTDNDTVPSAAHQDPSSEPASKYANQNIPSDSVASSACLSNPENHVTCFKLHGSLPQQTRTSIVKTFAATTAPSLLIATDVASRGLDLPNLDLVIEYDPAFSKEDHLHRIGRTARLGKDGRAVIFLLPGSEEGYVKILKNSYKTDTGSSNVTHTTADDLLKKGFSPLTGLVSAKKEWETSATDFQLDVERWVLSDPKNKEMAKKAFQSHIRAYATHITSERHFFDIKSLHLGHFAKAFGLRDPPGKVNMVGMGRKTGSSLSSSQRGRYTSSSTTGLGESKNRADVDDVPDTEESAIRMRQMVRNRKRMMGAGADEFNIA